MQRLKNDHYFLDAIKQYQLRHQINQELTPKEIQYMEAYENCSSNMSKDDMVCYAREYLYQHNVSRPIRKLFLSLKWIHQINRFEILRRTNDLMYEYLKADENHLKETLDYHKAFILNEFKKMDKEDHGSRFFLNELFLVMDIPNVVSLKVRHEIPPLILTTKGELE